MTLFFTTFLKFFFLLTPFFVMSTFLAMTPGYTEGQRRKLAFKVVLGVLIVSVVIFLLGNGIFSIFGITLDAFRVGTGVLMMLNAVSLVRGRDIAATEELESDIAIVPLAIPVTVGPATTGALLVMSGELNSWNDGVLSLLAVGAAIALVGILLLLSTYLEKLVKKQGLSILSKVTGLILSALAAQIFFAGLKGML